MLCTRNTAISLVMALTLLVGMAFVSPVSAQPRTAHDGDVTFTRDIAPILQRSCQQCHQPDSVAPMSLITYEEVRPWARAIKMRTGMGPVAGVMPPWYIEKNIGMIIVWLIGGGTMHQFTVMVLLMSIVGFYLL